MSDTAPPGLAAAFREAFRHHPAGVAVVAADAGDGPVALTVSSLISVSADPATVAFSLSAASASAEAVRRAGTMVIHFLRLEDLPLARLCATSGADRFGPGINWSRLASGEPRFADVAIWFRARILHEVPVAGAALIVAELLEGQVPAGGPPADALSMVYLNRRWHGLSAMLPGSGD